jgi:predicted nucleic acid-binding protein
VLGIAYTGTLGVVLSARRAGVIPAARPLVEALIAQGIRLSADLVARSLAEVGE